MTPDLGVASLSQEVGDVADESVYESSPSPFFPRRTREALRVAGASKLNEVTAGGDGLSLMGEEEPGVIVLDIGGEDASYEGLNAPGSEGPGEGSEQPMVVTLDDMEELLS
ncbi:hypothetical protein AMTR_s00107p00055350 [Amborella trichopoda]|uniref:Uncharacterized protein n=1 Tax=Amborella trichopoda TaxID=13333 RepID=W1NXB7_AMBTC|nr:hypothetical protein AMTR_s00107p00055350 [Amborella trichopoda]